LPVTARLRTGARETGEITLGLLMANIGDAINIAVLAVVVSTITSTPEALAVLPGLAALRGGIYTSQASRVSTRIHLGLQEPRAGKVIRAELMPTLSLGLVSAVYIGILSGFLAGLSVYRTLLVSIISTLISWIILSTGTGLLSIAFYKSGVDPDKVSAPVITVLGDMITIPSILAALHVLDKVEIHPIGYTAILSLALTVTAVVITVNTYSRAITLQSLPSILLVGVIESITGAILAVWAIYSLQTDNIVTIYPSFLEDTGAIVSVAAARTSTLTYLGLTSPEARLGREEMVQLFESYIAIIPSVIILSTLASLLAHIPITLGITVIGLSFYTVITLGIPFAQVLVKATHKLGLDPDNIVLPMITSIIDLTGTAIIALIAGLTV